MSVYPPPSEPAVFPDYREPGERERSFLSLGFNDGKTLQHFLLIAKKYVWLVLVCAVLGVGVGYLENKTSPNEYRAIANIEITQDTADQFRVDTSAAYDGGYIDVTKLDTEIAILKSSTLAMKTIQSLRLDQNKDFLPLGSKYVWDLSKIGDRHLSTVDAVGHGTDGEHAVGQRFPIDPPFGLVAMAWRDDDFVRSWLQRVMPRLTRAEIAQHQQVLADIRARGYGAWRFDDTHQSLHNRLAGVLASLEPTGQVTRQLTTLMTMVTLQSITDTLETDLASTEFVVLPIFGQNGQPEYQIEIHLGGCAGFTAATLDAALAHAQGLLSAGVAAAV